jgi:D-serine deaminase-like pyridoxal phosphate-dependent protein
MSQSMDVHELDTPALVVDLDVMERNLRRVAEYARQHHLRLRPHTKTHKSPHIARKQLELGASGLTVAKVSEAEVMLRAEPAGLLVAYPVIGRQKLERLTAVARQAQVTVALDSLVAARQLSEAAAAAHVEISVLAEVDAGMKRVGVAPGPPLVQLAQSVEKLPALRFEGITFYPGHIRDFTEAGGRAFGEVASLLRSILADFRAAGLEAKIVSGGSTPTLFRSHELEGLTEIRPGTYVFNDINTVCCGACRLEDCAATVLTTVVSTAQPGHIIVDGGSKTFSSDRLANSSEVTFGSVLEAPGARFHKMNEEHGYIDITRADRGFSIGDQLRIVPNHICVAVNLHEQMYGIRNGRVEEVWKVEGRGKLQ